MVAHKNSIMVMANPTKKSNQIIVLTKEERIALKSQQEVLLLLQQLAAREEVTVKLILDRLYDLGVLNIIQNKLRPPIIKGVVRGVAKVAKPVAGLAGVYWFQQNCPQLIADWLIDQVAFGNPEPKTTEILEASTNDLKSSESQNLQVKQLRSQVRLLTSILIIVITFFGSSFVWLFYSFKTKPSSLWQPTEISDTFTAK